MAVFYGRIGKKVIHVFPLGPFRPLVRQPPSLPSSPPVLLSVAKKPTARSATIQARVTPDELASLTAIATAQGVTTSEIVRRLVRSVAGLPITADPETRPAIEALVDQFRRVGVNLNQAVRAMNEGRVDYEPALAAVLDDLLTATEGARAAYREFVRPPRRIREAIDGQPAV